ncbi:MAG TPA: ABC transporter permease [Gemmatimonadaceae bacterium]|nr:ABC transporter permease [Gemmatimonadaceae bacterium]
MSWLTTLLRRARVLARKHDVERDMDAEMRFHIDMEAGELAASGIPTEEARRLARLRFGGTERYKEEGRDARGTRWVEDGAYDIRYALRTLRRSPGFTAVAVLTLALGIGATTAIFTAVNGVLLRPLPYQEPDRLVRLLGMREDRDTRGTVSYPDIMDWRAQNTVFEEVAAYDEWTVTLGGGEAPERVDGASVSSPFFRVLGVRPWRGRFFLPNEDVPGHEPVVVLSHGLWQRRYGADLGIIGRPIDVNSVKYTVVGITPPGFEDPALSGGANDAPVLWRVSPSYFNLESSPRNGRAFTAIARLKPDVPLARAQTELSAIQARLWMQYPEADSGHFVRLVPLKDQITAPVRPALLILLAATGLLVLIACVNVANLMLARAAGREREMALRTALGARRRRLVRQMITESLVLSAIGGALGIAIAIGVSRFLVSYAGDSLARAAQVKMDLWVLAFAAGASLLTGLAFGLTPALKASAVNLHSALKEGGRSSGGVSSGRLRSTLVAAQVAIALVLLTGAGLLIRSLWALERVDPGFSRAGVLTFEVNPPFAKYGTDTVLNQLYERLTEQLAALPGVSQVGTVDILPMSQSFNGMGVALPGREGAAAEVVTVETRSVTPGFFAALGIPLKRGRGFTDADGLDAPEVAIIDEAMAARYWPGQDPIGKQLIVYDSTRWEVVGIAGALRQFTLDRDPEPTLYLPRRRSQQWVSPDATVVVRTAGDPLALAPAVRAAVRSVDADIPVSDLRPIQQVVGDTVTQERLRTLLLALFAAIAFVIGAVGIYGVVSYGVNRRMNELGIRIALGAEQGQILRLVMGQGLRPVIAGAVLGVIGALAAGRVLASFLYGVSATDPITYAAVLLGLTVTATVATYLPARRATRADPITTLRSE